MLNFLMTGIVFTLSVLVGYSMIIAIPGPLTYVTVVGACILIGAGGARIVDLIESLKEDK